MSELGKLAEHVRLTRRFHPRKKLRDFGKTFRDAYLAQRRLDDFHSNLLLIAALPTRSPQ